MIGNYLILLTLIFSTGFSQLAWGTNLSRQEALTYLNGLKEENRKRLSDIDSNIQTKITEQSKATNQSSVLSKFEKDIEGLSRNRKEHLLRQDFLDRLSFQIDTNYKDDNLKEFLQIKLLDMARVESISLSSEDSLWKFMTYLSMAVKELPERGENILEFIEGYMKYSSIREPIKPADFLAQRHYTNGMTSVNSVSAEKENIGEVVENRLKETQAPSLKPPRPPAATAASSSQ